MPFSDRGGRAAVLLLAFCVLAPLHSASADPDPKTWITSSMIAVYTPMKAGGLELDLDRIPAYAAFIASKNITNVLPAGSNGESLSLSVAERKALAEAWAKAGPPLGLKIYMHIGAESLVDSRELARHSASTEGISGLVCMTPVYFKPSVQSLHDFLASVAAAAPELPFWYYHFPDDTGVIPGEAYKLLELVDQTGDIPNFQGIKFTDYNLLDFNMCLQVGGAHKYNMLFGRDEEVLSAKLIGADAPVSSTIGFSPTLRTALVQWEQGNTKAALESQAQNAKLCSFFGKYAAYNVQKNLMKYVGFDVGPSRLPKVDMSDEQGQALADELNKYDLLD